MESQVTKLLVLLILGMTAGMALAYSRLQSLRDGASIGQKDLAATVMDLADISGPSSDPAAGPQALISGSTDEGELNRRIRSAATAAGIPDEVASIDPGPARQIRDTDYDETVVFMRLTSVTLEQMVKFLHEISAHDRSMRTKSIELSPPQITEADAVRTGRNHAVGEQWTADLTLAYLTYTPHRRNK